MRWWTKGSRKTARRPGRVRGLVGWGWWYSSDQELYSGPFATRDEAIDAALDERCGAWDDRMTYGRFWVQEARQGPIRLSSWIEADDVLERLTVSIDDEHGGEDGIDWDRMWTSRQQAQLERWIKLVVRLWERWNRIVIKTWQFTSTRNDETYTWHRRYDIDRRAW